MSSRTHPAHPPGVANAGPRRSRAVVRPSARTVRHTLTGPVAWVDPDGGLVVLRIESASRRARRFVGTSATVDVSDARLSAPDRDGDGELSAGDLLPGERVTVVACLPARLDELPPTVPARALTCRSFG